MTVVWVWVLACGLADDDPCSREPPLTWETFGQGFMDVHCAGCHSSYLPEGERTGATVGVDLDTYAGVLTWADRVEARALGPEPTMPPGGGPTQGDLELLAEWLTCEVGPDVEALEAQ